MDVVFIQFLSTSIVYAKPILDPEFVDFWVPYESFTHQMPDIYEVITLYILNSVPKTLPFVQVSLCFLHMQNFVLPILSLPLQWMTVRSVPMPYSYIIWFLNVWKYIICSLAGGGLVYGALLLGSTGCLFISGAQQKHWLWLCSFHTCT